MRYFTRRELLKGIAAGMFTAAAARKLQPSFLFADVPSPLNRNLVVLRLNGGMCALEAFPFVGDTQHARQIRARRPLLPTPATAGIIDEASQLAFHTAWSPIVGDYANGGPASTLKIIHGFGNRLPSGALNLSHEFNQTLQAIGTPDFDSQSDGWLARAKAVYHLDNSQVMGLGVAGGTEFRHRDPAMRPYSAVNLADLTYSTLDDIFGGSAETDRLIAASRALRGAHLRAHPNSEITRKIVTGLDQMDEATTFFSSINNFAVNGLFGGYSNSNLGNSLKGIAKSIGFFANENKSRIFFSAYLHAEWDTHSAQAVNLAANITDASTNLAAFAADLRALNAWNRTTVITLSEFGRRVFDNGMGGTDHGTGTAALAYGGSVRGGLLMNPSLPSTDWTSAYYVPVDIHFQNLLAQSVAWLGFNSDSLIDPTKYTHVDLGLFRT